MNNIIVLQWVQIALFILTVAVAFYSVKIANKSLREAEKTRRDTFLPIVLVTNLHGISGAGSHVHGEISCANFGHGVAFKVKIRIPGTNDIDMTPNTIAAGKSHTHVSYGLPESAILDNRVITVTCVDIFGRYVQVLQEVDIVENYDNGRHLPRLKDKPPQILLP